jgi:folate-binding protein YgfZ
MIMSNQLDDQQLQQYQALNDNVGFIVLSNRTQIALTGRDRVSFLNNFCTNDIKKLTPGDGCEAFITNVQGKILAFVHVACGEDSIRLETVAGQAEKIITHLDRYLITEDVEFEDLSEQRSIIAIAGENSQKALGSLLEAPIPAEPNRHASAQFLSTSVLVQSVRATSGPCFFASVEDSAIEQLESALASAGAIKCSRAAWETCRIEAGFPEYDRDISEKNLPQEVGRNESAISLIKGCYLGQETVARIDALGHVNWHLTGIRCPDSDLPEPGAQFKSGDTAVGSVTSACYSPRLSSPLAMGYVRREYAEPGTKLSCMDTDAEVVQLPLSIARQEPTI